MSDVSALSFLTNTFDTDAIQAGAWLHLIGPDGAPLFIINPKAKADASLNELQLPVRVLVRSQQSDHFQAFLKANNEKSIGRGRRARNPAQQELMFRKVQEEAEAKTFSQVVVCFENLGKPGRINLSPEDLFAWAMMPVNALFVGQVTQFSADPASYGADKEGNAETGDGINDASLEA